MDAISELSGSLFFLKTSEAGGQGEGMPRGENDFSENFVTKRE